MGVKGAYSVTQNEVTGWNNWQCIESLPLFKLFVFYLVNLETSRFLTFLVISKHNKRPFHNKLNLLIDF